MEGFIGFAIGRSIWWDALKGFLAGDLERGAASDQIADNYLRFVKVYDDAERGGPRLAEEDRGLVEKGGADGL